MGEQEHEGVRLSPAGRARRDAMRDELSRLVPAAAARRRRRRLAARAGGAGAMLLLLGVWVWTRSSSPAPAPAPPIAQAPPSAPPTVRVSVIETPAGVADRLSFTTTARAERIGDEELLRLMREAGHPAGLVRTPERVYLTGDFGNEPQNESGA